MKAIIPLGCVLAIIAGPMLSVNRGTTIDKVNKDNTSTNSKTLVNSDFTVKVNNINKSNNDFVTCTYYVEQLKSELIGSCTTTSNMRLDVGRTYTVSSASVDAKGFIVINNAKLIAGMIRRQVVKVYHKGWTRLAKLDNGDVIGGDNVALGDWISIE